MPPRLPDLSTLTLPQLRAWDAALQAAIAAAEASGGGRTSLQTRTACRSSCSSPSSPRSKAMSLFYRLRRSVALIICPEMGVEARLKAAREAGFFDMDAARKHGRRKSAFRHLALLPAMSWRDVPRICLLGWFIRRAVEASAGPLYRVGPATHSRLERHIERLDDSRARGRLAALTRSAALWLTQSPNDARQAIPEQTCPAPSFEPTPDLSPASAQGSSRSGGKA